jgi:hypothetical protein
MTVPTTTVITPAVMITFFVVLDDGDPLATLLGLVAPLPLEDCPPPHLSLYSFVLSAKA